MSELNVKPIETLTWGEGASPNTHTEPVASNEDGYFEGTAPDHLDADVLPADHLNWLLRAKSRYINWLSASLVRSFAEIDDAVVAGLAHPDLFRYVCESAPVAPGAVSDSTQGAGGAVAISKACTDGRNIYYVQAHVLYCARLADPGTVIWSVDAGMAAITALACDGRYVYYGAEDINGVRLLAPSDGSTYATWNDHAGTYPVAIVADGAFVALVDTGDTDVLHAYSHTSGGVKTYLGDYDHTAAISALCVQGAFIYVAGAVGTDTYYLRKLDALTLVAEWEVDPGWSSTPNFLCLTCDGTYLYAGTETEEVEAGVDAQAHCFSLLDGSGVWSSYIGAASEVNTISHDQDYIIALKNAGPTAYIMDKVTGRIELTFSGFGALMDGARAIGLSADTYGIARFWLGRRRVEYQMDKTHDQYRPMGWMVATPLK